MSNVADFLSKLNDIKASNISYIWVPSQNKECEFSALTIKQQKDLLKASNDGVVGVVSFAKMLTNIVLENSLDKSIEFLSIDKYPLLVGLRINSMGDDINIDGKPYSLKDLPTLQNVSKKKLTASFTYKDVTVNAAIPTLKQEIGIFDHSSFELRKLKTETESTESVSILYTLEIIKFINSIVYEDKEIKFQDLSYTDRKQIVDNLPLALTQNVVKYISTIRDIENSAITFENDVTVPLDTLFFATD